MLSFPVLQEAKCSEWHNSHSPTIEHFLPGYQVTLIIHLCDMIHEGQIQISVSLRYLSALICTNLHFCFCSPCAGLTFCQPGAGGWSVNTFNSSFPSPVCFRITQTQLDFMGGVTPQETFCQKDAS